ncbi:MAG TPA: ABC transporter substrate-binding protein, partial [Acidimicrobiales bacterium]
MTRQRNRRWRAAFALGLSLTMLAATACADDSDDDEASDETSTEEGGDDTGSDVERLEDVGTVNVLNAMEPEEAEAIQAVMDETIDADYSVEIEASGQFEEQYPIRAEGETLDIALVPQPGGVIAQAEAGTIMSLEDLGFDIGELEELFGEYYVGLTEYEGEHWGLPTNINLKSMIWYPKAAFDEAGYEVPETWDDLIALSEQIVADGSTPWCVGFESGGASGWPATDWMEDIMLRTAGTDVYDQWVAHEIPFDDPAVVTAAERMGEIMFTDGFVLGGADQTPSIAFGDAPGPMFNDPPGCWLHRQASFINAFFPEDAEAGVDYDWFPFPTIEEGQDNILFGGEFAVVGTAGNREEVVDFLTQFMGEEVQCAMGAEAASSRISPNINVGPDCYANDILADSSELLTTALAEGTGRFDASDMLPGDVNSAFWTEMLGFMRDGADSAESHLAA